MGVLLDRRYAQQDCSVAWALEVVGERWALLIVRDVLAGVRRFAELQADLGIARNVLTRAWTRSSLRGSSSAAATALVRRAMKTCRLSLGATCSAPLSSS